MVVHVMPEQRKVNIVSVPRDTRVYVQNVGYTKINHAHIVGESKGGNEQGTLTLIQAVSDFMNIPIHHYIKTNFSGVRDFIDSIGGIDMVIDQDVTITPEITIKKANSIWMVCMLSTLLGRVTLLRTVTLVVKRSNSISLELWRISC